MPYAKGRLTERFHRWRTPPEFVQPPPGEIAAPVVQALQYTEQDEHLREMYLDLLARGMDQRIGSKVHPGFADMLKQLSPGEAQSLAVLPLDSRAIPLLEVRMTERDGWHRQLKHVNPLGRLLNTPTTVRREAIDNLVRVGILAIQELHHLRNEAIQLELWDSKESTMARLKIERAGGVATHHSFRCSVSLDGAR